MPRLLPVAAQQPQPVAVHDPGDVGLTVSTAGEQLGKALKIGDGVEVVRGLLAAKAQLDLRNRSTFTGQDQHERTRK